MWILGERLNARRVVGGAITIGGVLIVSLDGLDFSDVTRRDRAFGNILVMLAGISWSLFAVAQRRTTSGKTLYARLTPIFSVAALFTAPLMLLPGAWIIKPTISSVLMFVVLTVFGTGVVYWVYGRAQELIDVSVLSILLCSIPVFAVLFAYLLLKEPMTLQLAAGGIVIVSGIVVIATEKAGVQEKTAQLID
jgi:drug/metabolite transporter (DMT)-like permease